jgi:hypothetical protein
VSEREREREREKERERERETHGEFVCECACARVVCEDTPSYMWPTCQYVALSEEEKRVRASSHTPPRA